MEGIECGQRSRRHTEDILGTKPTDADLTSSDSSTAEQRRSQPETSREKMGDEGGRGDREG